MDITSQRTSDIDLATVITHSLHYAPRIYLDCLLGFQTHPPHEETFSAQCFTAVANRLNRVTVLGYCNV